MEQSSNHDHSLCRGPYRVAGFGGALEAGLVEKRSLGSLLADSSVRDLMRHLMAQRLFSVALMVVSNVSSSTHVSGICRQDGCLSGPLMIKSTVLGLSPMFR